MNFKEVILSFMREKAYRPMSAEEMAESLELKGKEIGRFFNALDELEHEAIIIKTRYGKYGLPEKMNLIVGRFEATSKGYGFVVPDNPESEDIFIPPHAMLNAMNNDRVVARIQSRPGGRRAEGEVIRIVKRANIKIVGTFCASRNFGFVVPDDRRIGQDIFVSKDDFNGAKDSQKVVVEITEWPQERKSAEGKIIEILGFKGDPGIEIMSIIRQHGLPLDFPQQVIDAADKVPDSVDNKELEGRRDLRDVIMVTIDSEDAKDLDDAVNVEKLDNGNYLLGVHIADVSHYVKENSILDIEARERGTSVYLVDRVLPMLPKRLSNGICSLNAGVDRLALSAYMEVNERGKIVSYELFPSVIKVHTRLSYDIVRQIIVDKDKQLRDEYRILVPMIEDMERLCGILRAKRMRRGAIDFDFPEQKVKLDEEGRPIAIVQRVRSIAESIIEEFMLAANETVAEHMSHLEIPFIFRIHEEPDEEKMAKLNVLLNNYGQKLARLDKIKPMMLQKVLANLAGRPEERFISAVMLRSLKQARYEAENLGHFGLAAAYYTHFTSPIRRYPDLIVHRMLRETWQGKMTKNRREKLTEILPQIAQHSSQRERAAAEAERETVVLKMVEYMALFIGQEFEGHISGVASYGMFVELENGVEGLVHVSSMDDDYYHYLEEQYSLAGERTHKVYQLGDKVKIKVIKVNTEEKIIDFALAETAEDNKERIKKQQESIKSNRKVKRHKRGEKTQKKSRNHR